MIFELGLLSFIVDEEYIIDYFDDEDNVEEEGLNMLDVVLLLINNFFMFYFCVSL